jgi:hypothetical protein
MSKSVFSMLAAIFAAGCTSIVVQNACVDASASDASMDDAALADSSTSDTAVADAHADSAIDAGPSCASEGECCTGGHPFRAGLSCWENGLPLTAASKCTLQGTCEPTAPQTCDVTNVCCNGWTWDPAWHGSACHCVPTNVLNTELGSWLCSDAPADNQSMAGNGLGYCVQGRCVEQHHQP